MFRICWELLTFWRLILVDLMQPCLNTGKYTILWVWLHEFKIRAYHWLMISATKKYLTSLPWLLWIKYIWSCWDFPGGSDSKQSACSVGDQVWSLGKTGPLEKRMLCNSVFLPGEFSEKRSLSGYSPWCCRVRHELINAHFHFTSIQDCKKCKKSKWLSE